MPVVVLSGARQTGKSTLLLSEPALRGRRYFTLDDPEVRETARRAPEALLSGPEPVTIDEVQRCPELMPAIKREVDRDRRPGRFLLSGSANLALLEQVSESLAGRAVYRELHPLSPRELAAEGHAAPFLPSFLEEPRLRAEEVTPPSSDAVLLGGMPTVALGQTPAPDLWFEGYESTYLERDVRNLARVDELALFRRVLRLCALRTGRLLNISELARDAGTSPATARRYLSLLEASWVIRRLPAWRTNRTARLVKSPKLHLVDSGLAAWMSGVQTLDPTRPEPMRGQLFETWATQGLASLLAAWLPRARLHHWSVQGRYEVDLVIELGRTTAAVEVKAGSRWTDRDLRGLRAFADRSPDCVAGILATTGTRMAALGERLWAVPLSLLLS